MSDDHAFVVRWASMKLEPITRANGNGVSGIYLICCTANGRVYVGQTVNFYRRRCWHLRDLRRGTHNPRLQNAFNKYGEPAFRFYIAEECPVERLTVREQFWMDKLDSFKNGFNCGPAADNPMRGMTHSVATKQKLSDIRGEKHHFFGKTHSLKTKQKMSNALRGEKHTLFGKTLSDETKRKLSCANRGQTRSDAVKQKISDAKCGERHHFFGETLSVAHKQKLSIAARAYWARLKLAA